MVTIGGITNGVKRWDNVAWRGDAEGGSNNVEATIPTPMQIAWRSALRSPAKPLHLASVVNLSSSQPNDGTLGACERSTTHLRLV